MGDCPAVGRDQEETAMNWANALRVELARRARAWAAKQDLPSYQSLGAEPTILFEKSPDGLLHGNFHPDSWKAIRSNPDWERRLTKPHSQRVALPEERRATAKELDSSNSSDALLMNCFCFPGVNSSVLGDSVPGLSRPVFGFPAGLRLTGDTVDATEVDMHVGGVIVEAKLTEADFTARPEAHVLRYTDLGSCFDVSSLPRKADSILSYQLIRNVLAAAQHSMHLVVLIDARRPDLLQEWWRVYASISDVSLRLRCGFRTWQQVAAETPPDLRRFLQEKYGL